MRAGDKIYLVITGHSYGFDIDSAWSTREAARARQKELEKEKGTTDTKVFEKELDTAPK